MLESMRNHAQSWIAKLILGGIALSFVLWGIGDYFTGSRVDVVAEVDGKPVTDLEFRQAFERQLNAYRAMMGRNPSKEMIARLGLKEDTLQTLINRRLLAEEAQRLGLVASEAVLVSSVRNDPSFQSAGQFNPQIYRIVTRNMGFRTTRDYEAEMRLNLMVDALQRAIAGSALVSDAEVRRQFDREYEQRVIAAVLIDPDSFEEIDVSDEEARAWYAEHKDDYRSPERVQANLVIIDPQRLGQNIEISQSDIAAFYEANQNMFQTPEERHARQIVVRVGTQAEEADWKRAKERIEKAKERLEKGEDFATVAEDVSDDVSAMDGGDLGFVSAGMLPPAVDEALFAMQVGQNSDIIKGDTAYYLLRLEEIKPAGVRALDAVRDQITDRLRQEKAGDEAYALSQDLDDALGREDSLKAAAAAVDLPVVELPALSRDEALADEWLGKSEALRKLVFRGQPGDVIHIEELDDGRFVAVEVVARQEPDVRPYEEVVASVHADARASKARERARALAEELLQAKNRDPDAVAQQAGQAKFLSKPVRRNGLGDDASWLTPDIVRTAFATAEGQWSAEPVETSRGVALVYVQQVIAASDDEFEEQKESIRAEVLRGKGAVRFARWLADLRDRHDIEIHSAVLDRI